VEEAIMMTVISVTDAARNFSDVINRVHYQGQTFLLTRGGKIVARLSAAEAATTGADLARLWQDRPKLEPENAAAWDVELLEYKTAAIPPQERPWDS
jgi:antitoxin (DNA-binding transcriptional repressor) of toxin-antitoxin stability system